jgi:hypothetical protein
LSLLVTPSFFSIVDDIEHFVRVGKQKLMRLIGRSAAKPVAGA